MAGTIVYNTNAKEKVTKRRYRITRTGSAPGGSGSALGAAVSAPGVADSAPGGAGAAPVGSGGGGGGAAVELWCVAKNNAEDTALQSAIIGLVGLEVLIVGLYSSVDPAMTLKISIKRLHLSSMITFSSMVIMGVNFH
ncbi:hypothetical protein HAX54_009554 [Datura stramonium]|uniref:Uncharacterized protein n=1 Tax=Datura stramonium TaxID=4076 RepID=A0ABS8RY63_DATST|nr:hypothetical protein [Datura stramonium]